MTFFSRASELAFYLIVEDGQQLRYDSIVSLSSVSHSKLVQGTNVYAWWTLVLWQDVHSQSSYDMQGQIQSAVDVEYILGDKVLMRIHQNFLYVRQNRAEM